jgi:hypothetical protein
VCSGRLRVLGGWAGACMSLLRFFDMIKNEMGCGFFFGFVFFLQKNKKKTGKDGWMDLSYRRFFLFCFVLFRFVFGGCARKYFLVERTLLIFCLFGNYFFPLVTVTVDEIHTFAWRERNTDCFFVCLRVRKKKKKKKKKKGRARLAYTNKPKHENMKIYIHHV